MLLEDTDDITVIGEAANGETGIRHYRVLRPDVTLLDIRMPGMDGIETTARMIDEDPTAKILVLTTFDLDEYAYQALRAGASGFLLKDALVEELVAGIRAIAAGHAVTAPRITRLLLDRFAAQIPVNTSARSPAPGAHPHLTGRENDVLLRIAQGASNAEIAAELQIGEVTVKTHAAAVLAKLGLRNRIAAAIYAHEHGFVPAKNDAAN